MSMAEQWRESDGGGMTSATMKMWRNGEEN
jgi:hypothetical protein